jgi:hypothetical protein
MAQKETFTKLGSQGIDPDGRGRSPHQPTLGTEQVATVDTVTNGDFDAFSLYYSNTTVGLEIADILIAHYA